MGTLQLAAPDMLADARRRGLPHAGEDFSDTRCDRAVAASRTSTSLLDRLTDVRLDDLFDAAGLMCLRSPGC